MWVQSLLVHPSAELCLFFAVGLLCWVRELWNRGEGDEGAEQ